MLTSLACRRGRGCYLFGSPQVLFVTTFFNAAELAVTDRWPSTDGTLGSSLVTGVGAPLLRDACFTPGGALLLLHEVGVAVVTVCFV